MSILARNWFILASLPLAIAAAPVIAQGGDARTDDEVAKQVEQMRRELERVRLDNQVMRGEIDQLRAASDSEWLTQQRADQIKGLVQDMLADADTRASLLDSGLTAGWDEHFFLSSPDGRFLLIFEGLEQIRWVLNHHDEVLFPGGAENDPWRSGFENTRTQLTFRGHIFSDNIEYLVRGEYARAGGANNLLDAWVRYLFTDKLSVRFGEFKLPFNREFLIGDGEQLAVERSTVSELFDVKRSQGIELEYTDSVNHVAAAFSDGGSSGIAGTNATNVVWSAADTEWAATARYERLIAGTWEQFNDFTSPPGDEFGMLFGVGVHGQQGEATNQFTLTRDETRFIDTTADLSVEWGGANAFLSGYYAYLDSPTGIFDIYGVLIQAGVYLAPKWEVFGRFEYMMFESNAPHLQDFGVASLGVNYYMDGHDLKWTTDFSFGIDDVQVAPDITGFRFDQPGAGPQLVFRTQFQLMF